MTFPDLRRDQQSLRVDDMLLRDWLAGKALAGIPIRRTESAPDVIARTAYAIADAMLHVREKP